MSDQSCLSTLTVACSFIKTCVIDVSQQPLQWETVSEEEEGEENKAEYMKQDVIPQALLDHYLSMTDPSRAMNIDQDIARHCAYSLPAVAYTLGKRFWPCLQDLYETLASDMQVQLPFFCALVSHFC